MKNNKAINSDDITAEFIRSSTGTPSVMMEKIWVEEIMPEEATLALRTGEKGRCENC